MINFPDSPVIGQQFTVSGTTWTWDGTVWTATGNTLGISDAPTDGQVYARSNSSWVLSSGSGGGISDAPSDTTLYGRKNNTWAHVAHTDITDWTATLAPYALATSVPAAATATPLMDGTAAVGTGTTFARADHIHPHDTTLYSASNPAGYIPDAPNDSNMYARSGAAWVAMPTLGVTISAAPPSSPSAGQMWWDSVGGQLYVYYNDGTSSQWVVANNQGAALANYLPLLGGTLTGALILAADPTVALGAVTKQYVDNNLANYLPLAGGTLTGQLNGTSASFSSVVGASNLNVNNGQFVVFKGTAPNPVIYFNDGSTNRTSFYFNVASGQSMWSDNYTGANIVVGLAAANNIQLNTQTVYVSSAFQVGGNMMCNGTANFGNGTAGGAYYFRGTATANTPIFNLQNSAGTIVGQLYMSGGTLILGSVATSCSVQLGGNVTAAPASGNNFIVNPGQGYQTGGGSWAALSDARIKTVERDYKLGLDEVLKLRPVVYRYKGNDALEKDGPSMNADTEKPFVGLVAQEAESVMPGMVETRRGFIDGEEVDDLRTMNTSELIYALVNAVKTLTARVEELESAR